MEKKIECLEMEKAGTPKNPGHVAANGGVRSKAAGVNI